MEPQCQEGEDPFQNEVRQLFVEATKTILMAAERGIEARQALLLSEIPSFVQVLLLPRNPAVLAEHGRKARYEVYGNQRLIKTLITEGYSAEKLKAIFDPFK